MTDFFQEINVVASSGAIILFGGSSNERKVSVASAQHLSSILPSAKLWFWSLDGSVFDVGSDDLARHEKPYDSEFNPLQATKIAETVDKALERVGRDVVCLSLHGGDGENGWIQAKLEARKIPYTGSGSVSSQLAMDKSRSKDVVKSRGLLVAKQTLFKPTETVSETLTSFQKSTGSIVVKPACDGSSSGLAFLKTHDDCKAWFNTNKQSSALWLAEEELVGRELTVGVISHQGMLMALPPSEVILEKNVHFDFQAKYHGVGNREVTPAELTPLQTSAAQEVGLIAHAALGCYGYTRTDMIMTSAGFFYLETNTLPGMTRASFIPQQLKAARIELQDFVLGQLDLARARYL